MHIAFRVISVLVGVGCLAAASRIRAPREPEPIPPSAQRTGNAERGYQYLVTGDYLKSGIPYAYYSLMGARDTANQLKRTGVNKNIRYDFTAVKATNGELVVAPNCLQCHAQEFEGKLVVGMGNSFSDFTRQMGITALAAEKFLQNLKGEERKKYDAAKNFLAAVKAISPYLVTKVKGVNLADALAALLVMHRDPQTLRWSDKPLLPLPVNIVPTDVPAWWLLKKKNGMFYTGFGRGDFGRFLMASNLLTVSDSTEAAEVDSHFNDVLAYINSIEAPSFPKTVDAALVNKGAKLFTNHCARCHGTYGKDGHYPNLLIPSEIIRTDTLLYSSNYSEPAYANWFNNSWFASGDHPARLVPYTGYIAPPLDGIWATAPYLHNGSVPTLEGVLNSSTRPARWKRDERNPLYNYTIPGWEYTVPAGADTLHAYDTRLPGFGNGGHYFGDKLRDADRRALIEYLKTL